jgi:uncharacterized protein YcgI (DUF1989 family)
MKLGAQLNDVLIPPYSGRAVTVDRGQHLFIVDVDGKQVGDFVAFNRHDPAEYVSPTHMRASLGSLRLREGAGLYSNRRRPLMRLLKDTVGVHDFFFPACDYWRYKVDFGLEDHPNCHDNLLAALRPELPDIPCLPDPINFFMNNRLDAAGDYVIAEPLSKPGDYVELVALEDLLVAVATCSQDLVPVNGMKVTRLRLQVYAGGGDGDALGG